MRNVAVHTVLGALLLSMAPDLAVAEADPYTKGMRAFAEERFEAAIMAFQSALEKRPGFPPYNYHLGMSYVRNGQRQEAVEAFNAVISAGDVDAELREKAYVNMFRALVDLEAYERIEEIYAKHREHIVKSAEVLNQIGRSRLNRGNFEGAIEILTRATQLDAKSWTIFNNLGLAYLNAGNLTGAKIAFERATELNGRLPFVYNNLGHAYEGLGDYTRAVAAFRKALNLDPNYKKARVALRRVERLRARSDRKRYVVEPGVGGPDGENP